jgi:hypothetical protein
MVLHDALDRGHRRRRRIVAQLGTQFPQAAATVQHGV